MKVAPVLETSKLNREELILALAVAFKALGDTPEQEDVFGRAQKQIEDLINSQHRMEKMLRETRVKIKGENQIKPDSNSYSEMVDWVDMWRIRCAHSGNKENCFNCFSRKECDKAIDEIRKILRGLG